MIVSHLTLTYPGKPPTLKNISWQIKPGTWLGITGSNGSGKTSLLYCLAGLIPQHIPAKITGKTLINQSAGIVFQNPDFSLFNLTVAEEVAFGATASVDSALKAVGIWRYRKLYHTAKNKRSALPVFWPGTRKFFFWTNRPPCLIIKARSSFTLYSLN